MQTYWYGLGLLAVVNRSVDVVADTLLVTLHGSAYTPSRTADQYFTSATAELATANGYTAGGQALASKSIVFTAATGKVQLRAAPTQWTVSANSIGPFRYAVVRKSTGAAATDPLVCYVDFLADQTSSGAGAPVDINWDATDGFADLTLDPPV